jgi:hypothetical protein
VLREAAAVYPLGKGLSNDRMVIGGAKVDGAGRIGFKCGPTITG